MNKLNKIGKLIILTGVLILLKSKDGYYGWGGYVDNSLMIIVISLIVIIIGGVLIKFSYKNK